MGKVSLMLVGKKTPVTTETNFARCLRHVFGLMMKNENKSTKENTVNWATVGIQKRANSTMSGQNPVQQLLMKNAARAGNQTKETLKNMNLKPRKATLLQHNIYRNCKETMRKHKEYSNPKVNAVLSKMRKTMLFYEVS